MVSESLYTEKTRFEVHPTEQRTRIYFSRRSCSRSVDAQSLQLEWFKYGQCRPEPLRMKSCPFSASALEYRRALLILPILLNPPKYAQSPVEKPLSLSSLSLLLSRVGFRNVKRHASLLLMRN